MPARARVTTRLRRECGAGIADRFTCLQAGSRHYRVSWPVAHRAYVEHVEQALAAPLPPVCVLGIDETRRGRIKWVQDRATGRWRVAHDRWHTAIVDAAGTGGLLAHVDGRTAAKVSEWLTAQPDPWRAGVTHVTIDLSASYLRAVTDASRTRWWSPTGSTWSASPTTCSPRSASPPPATSAAAAAARRTRNGPAEGGC